MYHKQKKKNLWTNPMTVNKIEDLQRNSVRNACEKKENIILNSNKTAQISCDTIQNSCPRAVLWGARHFVTINQIIFFFFGILVDFTFARFSSANFGGRLQVWASMSAFIFHRKKGREKKIYMWTSFIAWTIALVWVSHIKLPFWPIDRRPTSEQTSRPASEREHEHAHPIFIVHFA